MGVRYDLSRCHISYPNVRSPSFFLLSPLSFLFFSPIIESSPVFSIIYATEATGKIGSFDLRTGIVILPFILLFYQFSPFLFIFFLYFFVFFYLSYFLLLFIGRLHKVYRDGMGTVKSLAFHPTERAMAAVSLDRYLRVYGILSLSLPFTSPRVLSCLFLSFHLEFIIYFQYEHLFGTCVASPQAYFPSLSLLLLYLLFSSSSYKKCNERMTQIDIDKKLQRANDKKSLQFRVRIAGMVGANMYNKVCPSLSLFLLSHPSTFVSFSLFSSSPPSSLFLS